jgi:hypothetical protein
MRSEVASRENVTVSREQEAPLRFRSGTADEARNLAAAKAKSIAALSWSELDAYGKREEAVRSDTGRSFRVMSHVFWDMEDWESAIYVFVKVYPSSGWRRLWGYTAVETRGMEDDDPPPGRPVVSTGADT